MVAVVTPLGTYELRRRWPKGADHEQMGKTRDEILSRDLEGGLVGWLLALDLLKHLTVDGLLGYLVGHAGVVRNVH